MENNEYKGSGFHVKRTKSEKLLEEILERKQKEMNKDIQPKYTAS